MFHGVGSGSTPRDVSELASGWVTRNDLAAFDANIVANIRWIREFFEARVPERFTDLDKSRSYSIRKRSLQKFSFSSHTWCTTFLSLFSFLLLLPQTLTASSQPSLYLSIWNTLTLSSSLSLSCSFHALILQSIDLLYPIFMVLWCICKCDAETTFGSFDLTP